MSKPASVERWVVAGDLHHPKVSWPTWDVLLEVVADIQPQGFVFQGDQFDNEEISHHTKGKPLFRERGAYRQNTESFEGAILTPLERILPKTAKKVYIIGNHERFEYDLIEEQPELESVLDHVTMLSLEKRGWQIIPLGHSYQIGELSVAHGDSIPGGAGTPARKAVEIYGANVLIGHTHAPQSFAKISPVEQKKKHMGYVNAILGTCNPAWLRNRPNAWLNGFTVVEKHPNGFFNCYVIIVSDGRCSYGGKLYGRGA